MDSLLPLIVLLHTGVMTNSFSPSGRSDNCRGEAPTKHTLYVLHNLRLCLHGVNILPFSLQVKFAPGSSEVKCKLADVPLTITPSPHAYTWQRLLSINALKFTNIMALQLTEFRFKIDYFVNRFSIIHCSYCEHMWFFLRFGYVMHPLSATCCINIV